MDSDAELNALLERIGRRALAQRGKPLKRNIFDVGTSFHDAAKRCAEERPGSDGEVMTPTSPMIACFAFASELYLKSLLDGTKARGHDLEKLFDRLSSNEKDGITRRYEELTGRSKAALRKDIRALANAFVDWRYIFEKGTSRISVHWLAALALAIYRHIRATKQEWDVRPKLHEAIERQLPNQTLALVSMGGGVVVKAVLTAEPQRSPENK